MPDSSQCTAESETHNRSRCMTTHISLMTANKKKKKKCLKTKIFNSDKKSMYLDFTNIKEHSCY